MFAKRLAIGILPVIMRRHELTDEQWERLSPLLPPEKPRTGRKAKDHRTIITGILWILRTGAPWRTVASRFYRFRKAGIWERVLAELKRDAEVAGRREVHYVDATVIGAHQHAAGAKKGEDIKP